MSYGSCQMIEVVVICDVFSVWEDGAVFVLSEFDACVVSFVDG